MEHKNAVASAFLDKASDIDEHFDGYRMELIKAVMRILTERDIHGTDQSRRTAIEETLSPLVSRLTKSDEKGE